MKKLTIVIALLSMLASCASKKYVILSSEEKELLEGSLEPTGGYVIDGAGNKIKTYTVKNK